jgi:hypothetical protein
VPTTKPPAISLGFGSGSGSGKIVLSANVKTHLSALAEKLNAGASVTITGYAKGNASLAKD